MPPEELHLTLRAKRSAWISYRDWASELPYSSVYRLIATHRDAVGADPRKLPMIEPKIKQRIVIALIESIWPPGDTIPQIGNTV